MSFKIKALAAASVLALGTLGAGTASAVPVALELALLVDVSGSVDASEYNLQKTGYVNAFNDPAIHAAIASLTGGIAVTYIEWASGNQQAQLVGWSHLTDATSAGVFASAIAGTSRAFSGNTGPGSAINFATPLFGSNDFEGGRWVIDVSGDGTQNSGADTSDARDAFLAAGAAAGVTASINGLAIGPASLVTWYQNNIQGGPNSFVIQAQDFAAFDAAVRTKIGREITNTVPEPISLALVGMALAAAGIASRRRG